MYSLIIVDDESITRIAISGYIQKTNSDFRVDATFSNGADALAYIEEHPVNVVITDIVMPEMNGIALAEQISRKHPGIIVMIISGYGEFEYAQKAIHYGVSTYLLKPLDFSELSYNLLQAKERLDAIHASTDCSEENIQLFFSDLICGSLNQEETLKERFALLPFEAAPSDYKGCLLTVTLENGQTALPWKYGLETLVNALLNGIRMSLPEYQCFHLFRNHLRYYFILLSLSKLPNFSLEILEGVLYQLLRCPCRLQIQSSFSNLMELSALSTRKQDFPPFLSAAKGLPDIDTDDIVLKKALSYIHAHFAQDLTREDVANAVFLSPAYFSRTFKEKVGLSFSDYLTTVRMQKAVELLNTNMKVSDISEQVGYRSRNRFFINFRRYSGYTPTEYRRQILRMEVYEDAQR